MADGGGEGAKGNAKNGGGMWFRIDVPSPGAYAVGHFGKPGPAREFGYGYPGISFWTSSDFTAKVNNKIFLESGNEFINVAGEGLALISRSMVNLIGTVAVNIDSPGTVWLSAISSAKAVQYQRLGLGGPLVPTDTGRAAFTDQRNVIFKTIQSYQNWAAVIDGVIEVSKSVLGFSNKSTLQAVASTLSLAGKAAETAAKTVKAYKDSPSPGASAANEENKPKGFVDEAVEVIEGGGFKVAKEMGEAGLGMWDAEEGTTAGKWKGGAEKIGKFMSMLEGAAKMYKAYQEVFGEKKAEDDSGSINFVAEQNMVQAIAKKQTTIAGEGVEVWVPSIKDGFQVVAGGGITLKSGLKTEVFSIQAVSLEGLLGSTLAAAGPVQVMSRLKATDVLGKEVKVGANAANVPASSKEIATVLQKGWNPMRQKATEKIKVEVDAGGKIIIHVKDEKCEILMDDKQIKLHFDGSKSTITMNDAGIELKTDKTIKLDAEDIVSIAKKTISSTAGTSMTSKVGGSSIELSGTGINSKSGGNSAAIGPGTTQLK